MMMNVLLTCCFLLIFWFLAMCRYEDVAIEPVRMLGTIYAWAGIGAVEPRIAQWAYDTTHASKADNDFRIQVSE